MDKRIGTQTEAGIVWPELTISGQPYTPPATQMRHIGPDQFVVLDPFPARDQYGTPLVDVEAEIAKLKPKPAAGLAPESKSMKAKD